MKIVYDGNLKNETGFIGVVIAKVLCIKTPVSEQSTITFLKYNKIVNGFEPKQVRSKIGKIVVTDKDLFVPIR